MGRAESAAIAFECRLTQSDGTPRGMIHANRSDQRKPPEFDFHLTAIESRILADG